MMRYLYSFAPYFGSQTTLPDQYKVDQPFRVTVTDENGFKTTAWTFARNEEEQFPSVSMIISITNPEDEGNLKYDHIVVNMAVGEIRDGSLVKAPVICVETILSDLDAVYQSEYRYDTYELSGDLLPAYSNLSDVPDEFIQRSKWETVFEQNITSAGIGDTGLFGFANWELYFEGAEYIYIWPHNTQFTDVTAGSGFQSITWQGVAEGMAEELTKSITNLPYVTR